MNAWALQHDSAPEVINTMHIPGQCQVCRGDLVWSCQHLGGDMAFFWQRKHNFFHTLVLASVSIQRPRGHAIVHPSKLIHTWLKVRSETQCVICRITKGSHREWGITFIHNALYRPVRNSQHIVSCVMHVVFMKRANVYNLCAVEQQINKFILWFCVIGNKSLTFTRLKCTVHTTTVNY